MCLKSVLGANELRCCKAWWTEVVCEMTKAKKAGQTEVTVLSEILPDVARKFIGMKITVKSQIKVI